MKIHNNGILLLFFTLIIIQSGCFFNAKKNIDSLPDKKFYFAEFRYNYPGQSKDEALIFYKKFPVKKLMYLLAGEYNIIIDISEYTRFIYSKDTSKIEADGSFRVMSNTWRKQGNDNNRITITFEQDFMDNTVKKYSISIFNSNYIIKVFNSDILSIDKIPENFASKLSNGEKNLKDYIEKKYDNTQQVPGIIDAVSDGITKEEQAEISKIKNMIEDYVKTLDQKQKNSFKHEIIDFIYQKCN